MDTICVIFVIKRIISHNFELLVTFALFHKVQ